MDWKWKKRIKLKYNKRIFILSWVLRFFFGFHFQSYYSSTLYVSDFTLSVSIFFEMYSILFSFWPFVVLYFVLFKFSWILSVPQRLRFRLVSLIRFISGPRTINSIIINSNNNNTVSKIIIRKSNQWHEWWKMKLLKKRCEYSFSFFLRYYSLLSFLSSSSSS